jgi:hypothetical protein
MLRVIIESPYRGDLARNIAYARTAVRHSLDLGEAPFAAHLLYTQPGILDDDLPRERAIGLQAGYEWYHDADLVAFYVDLGWSIGMHKAIKIARLFQRKFVVRTIAHVGDQLREAGIVEPIESPVEGVQAYRFKP